MQGHGWCSQKHRLWRMTPHRLGDSSGRKLLKWQQKHQRNVALEDLVTSQMFPALVFRIVDIVAHISTHGYDPRSLSFPCYTGNALRVTHRIYNPGPKLERLCLTPFHIPEVPSQASTRKIKLWMVSHLSHWYGASTQKIIAFFFSTHERKAGFINGTSKVWGTVLIIIQHSEEKWENNPIPKISKDNNKGKGYLH